MGQRKRGHTRQPSIIHSSVDRQFSPSKQTDGMVDISSQGDSDGGDTDESGWPVSPSAKRPRTCSTSTAGRGNSTKLTYMVLVFSAVEMKKVQSKQVAKSYTLQLDTDEPWDTMQAQLLSKIDNALQPRPLDFTLFDISFTIPRIVPKPGMPLETEASYSILLQRACKAKEPPIISISICQKGAAGLQEDLNNANNDKGKKKSCDPAMLPGNIKKNKNMKALRE